MEASRGAGAMISDARVTVREVLIVCGVLAAALLLSFTGRILDGGWTTDDWAIHAELLYSRGGLSGTWNVWLDKPFGYRTLYWPYSAIYHEVLGDSQRRYLVLAVLTAGLLALFVHLLLRKLRVAPVPAAAVATLGIVAPSANFTKIWAIAHAGQVASCFVIGGILIALWGVTRRNTSVPLQVAIHALALVVMFIGVTLYEVPMPWVGLAGAGYWWLAGPRKALPRWAADIATCIVWYFLSRGDTFLGKAPDPVDRAVQTLGDGFEVLAATLFPLSRVRGEPYEPDLTGIALPHTTLALGLGILAVCLAVGWFLQTGQARDTRWTTSRQYVVFSLAGLVVAFASWVVIVPANEFYRPIAPNEANRVNMVAAFGLAACVYGALVAAVAAVLARLEVAPVRLPRVASAVGVAAATLIAVQGIEVNQQYSGAWNRAYAEQLRILDVIKAQFPDGKVPSHGIVLLTSGVDITPDGAEVFFANWPLHGALRYQHKDGTVTGFPTRDGARYYCDKRGVRPYFIQYAGTTDGLAPYGRVHLIDVNGTGRRWQPKNQDDCWRVLAEAGLIAPPRPLPEPGTT